MTKPAVQARFHSVFSEVKQITYRKSRPALTAIAIAIPVVLGLLLVAGIIAADME